MKNHPVYRPLRTSLAVLALGVSGLFVYQQFNQPAKPQATSVGGEQSLSRNSASQTKVASQKNRGTSAQLNSTGQQDSPQSQVAHSLFQEFNDWAGNYVKATPAEQQKMLSRGDAMVKQRHEKMASLIKENPELALAESDALAPLVRDALPDSLKQQLEQPVNARGDLTVIAYTGGEVPYKRFTTFDDEEYTVYPANKSESLYKELDRSLLGIKLSANRVTTAPDGQQYSRVDRVMALRKDRVRVLNTEQSLVALKALGKKEKTVCSVSAKSVAKSTTPVVIELGGASKGMCQPEHASGWLLSAEGIKAASLPPGHLAIGGSGEGTANGTYKFVPEGHATGQKSLLVVRFRCPDQPETTYNQLETTIPSMLSKLNKWSYGKINFNSYTISPLIVLPRTMAEYSSGQYNAQNDAWAIAENNYNLNNYSFSSICVKDLWDFGGSAAMVSTTFQINSADESVFQHELGHCFGLPHANFWNPTTTDPIGPGTWENYGGSYDVMGSNWSPFNTMNRFYIRWLTMAETHNLASRVSGTYKIYDPDVASLIAGRKYTIQIPRSDGTYYFVEYRPRPTESTDQKPVDATTQNGIRILRTKDAELVDVTPLSPNSRFDAALLVGKEFYDAGEDILIRAAYKGGAGADQYFDVEVSFSTKNSVASGSSYLLRSIESNNPFGIANSSSDNGSPVTRMSSNGALSQKWVAMKVDGNYYKIVNVNSRKVLEVSGYSLVNGGRVQQWDYTGTPSQKWQIIAVGIGKFKLINAGSNLALSVPYVSNDPVQQLQQYTYLGASNQLWAFDEVSPVISGANYTLAARHSGKAMDVAGSSVANGTYIYQWTVVPYAPFQKWTASTQGGAQLAFTNVGSQKVLEVGGFAMGDAGGIQQWQWAGHNWQKWTLEVSDQDSEGFWYKMVNVGSGKLADVSGVSVSNGAKVIQYSSWGGANQQWRISRVQ